MKITREKLQTLFPVAIVELVIFYGSLFLIEYVISPLWPIVMTEDDVTNFFLIDLVNMVIYALPILFCVVYMLVVKPDSKKYLRFHPLQTISGLAVGLLMNIACTIGAVAGTHMTISFRGITVFLLPIFFANIIQCGAEEVLLRGLVPSFLEEKYTWDVIAFLSGVLFLLAHISAVFDYGFNTAFCLNVLLISYLLTLVVKHTGNIWWAVGMHSGWNFSQAYLLGLPDSELFSPLSLFEAENPQSNFIFDETYGNEGAFLCTVLLLVVILLIHIYFRRKASRQAA